MASLISLFLHFITLLFSHSPWTSFAPSESNEIYIEISGYFTLYKNGTIVRSPLVFVPASLDPLTNVLSKDLLLQAPNKNLSTRLYLPKMKSPDHKLPLLIYIHGGSFCILSPFIPAYHNYLNSLVGKANVVAMTVDYSLAPEHPLPIAYEESWSAVQWALSKSNDEEWFRKYVDFDRVFIAGDSAGGNIAHNMAIRGGVLGIKFEGIVLVHPLFSGVEPIGNEVVTMNNVRAGELWSVMCPSSRDSDDPRINPEKDVNLCRLGCNRVLVCVAGEDMLRDRGILYYEKLGESGWNGVEEFIESQGEDHVFHLADPTSVHAKVLMNKVVSFLNNAPESDA